MIKQDDKSTILDRVAINNDGCWIWKRSATKDGYGQIGIRVNGVTKNLRAHRFSWSAFNGEIPKGMMVCHKCDVRLCVNPDHLFIATHRENMNDMANKCRSRNRYSEKSMVNI